MSTSVARHPAQVRRAAAFGDVLRRQARDAAPPESIRAIVSMDVGDRGVWSAWIEGGRIEVARGDADEPTLRVFSDAETLGAVIAGERSGVHEFLRGKLRVRGNLALALKLDGLFQNEDRPVRWPAARSVRAAGIHTEYLEAGRGFPVVLLHGLGATNASMLPTLWDLGRDHRVIAPDLPGFGDSAKPVRAYSARFYGTWLRGLLDALGIERAHLVGNSMGGRIAIEGGLEVPDRVDRLVLLAPSPAFIRNREFVRIVKLLRPELALLPLRLPHKQVVRNIRWMFSKPSRLPYAWYEAAADEFLRVFTTARGRIAFFSAARQIYLEEPHGDRGFWDRLPALGRPSLFIWGDRDRLVPAKFAPHVERALPNARSIVLEDSGHVPQYEHPRLAHRLIREFIGASA